MDTPPQKKLWSRVMWGTLFGGLTFAALAFYADAEELAHHLRNFDLRYLGLALSLALGNYLIRFLRWQFYLMRLNISVRTWPSLLIFFSGFAMSVTPGKIGEVFKSMLLQQQQGTPIAQSAPIVIAERLTDLIALVALVAIGCLALPSGWITALLGAAAVLCLWTIGASPTAASWVVGILQRFERTRRIAANVEEAFEALHLLLDGPSMLWATLLSLASWSLECVALWVIVLGFDHNIEPLAAVFGYSAPTIVGALAMLPGGLLVTEASMTTLLMDMAMLPKAIAAGVTLLTRLATLWWAVALGFLAFSAFSMGENSEIIEET